MSQNIKELLGSEADSLLNYKAKFPKEKLNLPGPDFVDRVFAQTDRNINVLKNLQWIFYNGRLKGTGYVSILPLHSGSFCLIISASIVTPRWFACPVKSAAT